MRGRLPAVCMHTPPHTPMGMPGQGCRTAQPVYFCSPCEGSPCDNICCAYVGGGRIAKPPSDLAALHTETETYCLSVSSCWQPAALPILPPALCGLGPLDARESLRLPSCLLASRFRGNLFAFVSAFDFTCSQLPVPPLGRALTCAECGVLSAAEATSDATSNAMLVPCRHLGAALRGLCSLPTHIYLFFMFFFHFFHFCSPLWVSKAAWPLPTLCVQACLSQFKACLLSTI